MTGLDLHAGLQEGDSSTAAAEPAGTATQAAVAAHAGQMQAKACRLDRECRACMDVLPLLAMLPCGHRTLCQGCAEDWVARNPVCPLCRGGVKGWQA